MSFNQGHALIIGVGKYRYAGELDEPVVVSDAQATEQLIKDQRFCGYPVSQVALITDENATRAGILASLDGLVGCASLDDTCSCITVGMARSVRMASTTWSATMPKSRVIE